MRYPHNRSVKRSPYVSHIVSVGCAALTLFFISCSGDRSVQSEERRSIETAPASPYSIIFVIHGDGDYGYHDTHGNEYTADEEALTRAKTVAVQNHRAEVFIFHQKPERNFLFFFPRRNGEFFYYRNGNLIAHEQYWREEEQSHFEPEVTIYRRFRPIADDRSETVRLFVYAGHEIPESGGSGYDASFPDRAFTVQHLALGLKGFTQYSSPMDLLVLSTCFGGTPYTIGTLGAYARYIVASPDNLHLSYFDLLALEQLDQQLQEGKDDGIHTFAKKFAYRSFDRLAKEIQTSVSVAVYDVNRVQVYLRSVRTHNDPVVTSMTGERQKSADSTEHCDCAELSAYVQPRMNEGVEIFYRAPRFGRSKEKQNHSGWECRREKRPESVTTQYIDRFSE